MAEVQPEGLAPALHDAVKAAQVETVGRLLGSRADASARDPKGVSPLHAAAFAGEGDVLRLLIESRADLDVRDRHGQTPLFFAPRGEICALLVDAKADADRLNKKGQTALHLAAHAGMDEVVEWLCSRMSPGLINAQDKHGRTALWCARTQGLRDTVALLEASGASARLQPHKAQQERRFNSRRLQFHSFEPVALQTFQDAADVERQLRRLEAEMEVVIPGQVPGRFHAAEPATQLWASLPPPALLEAASEEGASVCEFEAISPKRKSTELLHLSDVTGHRDHDVLAVLAAEALGGDGEEDALASTLADARQCEDGPPGPPALADARQCEDVPPGPPALPDARQCEDGPPGPPAGEPPAMPGFPVAKPLSVGRASMEGTDEALQKAAVRIQSRARGTIARQQVRQRLVQKVERDGCVFWEVVLWEEATRSEPFGFSFVSGKVEFAKRLAVQGSTSSADPVGPEALLVRRVASGYLLDKWNLAHPDADVVAGDRIVEVNGVTGVRGMSKELRTPAVRMLVAQYPEWFQVELAQIDARRRTPVGLEWENVEHESLTELKVTAVSPAGLVEAANQRFIAKGLFHYVVSPGMRIEAVNEVSGDVGLMAARLTEDPVLKLRIRRAEVGAVAKEKLKRRLFAWRALRFAGQRAQTPSVAFEAPRAREDEQSDIPAQEVSEAQAAAAAASREEVPPQLSGQPLQQAAAPAAEEASAPPAAAQQRKASAPLAAPAAPLQEALPVEATSAAEVRQQPEQLVEEAAAPPLEEASAPPAAPAAPRGEPPPTQATPAAAEVPELPAEQVAAPAAEEASAPATAPATPRQEVSPAEATPATEAPQQPEPLVEEAAAPAVGEAPPAAEEAAAEVPRQPEQSVEQAAAPAAGETLAPSAAQAAAPQEARPAETTPATAVPQLHAEEASALTADPAAPRQEVPPAEAAHAAEDEGTVETRGPSQRDVHDLEARLRTLERGVDAALPRQPAEQVAAPAAEQAAAPVVAPATSRQEVSPAEAPPADEVPRLPAQSVEEAAAPASEAEGTAETRTPSQREVHDLASRLRTLEHGVDALTELPQQLPSTSPPQGALPSTSPPRAPPAGAAREVERESVCGYSVGDGVFIWSSSQGRWQPCRVAAVFPEDTTADGLDILSNTVKVESASGAKYVAEGQLPHVLRRAGDILHLGSPPLLPDGALQQPRAGPPEGARAGTADSWHREARLVTVYGYSAGDRVEIWSTSKGAWLPGRIEAVFAEAANVDGYVIDANTIKAQVCVDHGGRAVKYIREAQITELLRAPALRARQAASARGVCGYSAGDSVQVYSTRRGRWLPGVVKAVFPEDTIADGYDIMANTIKVESAAGVKYVVEASIAEVVRKTAAAPAATPPEAPAGPAPPPQAEARIFSLSKSGPDDRLGVQLCAVDGGALVMQISADGAVSRRNAAQGPAGPAGSTLEMGDVITQVNGVRGDFRAMREEIQGSQELSFRVERRYGVVRLEVSKASPDEAAGIEHRNVEGYALVLRIVPGSPADRANRASADRSPPGPELRVTDIVFQVNDSRRSYNGVLEELQGQQHLTIHALQSREGAPGRLNSVPPATPPVAPQPRSRGVPDAQTPDVSASGGAPAPPQDGDERGEEAAVRAVAPPPPWTADPALVRSRGAAEAAAELAAAPAGPGPQPGTSSEELRHAAAARIQATHRGRTVHRRFQEEMARLVPREHADDGCIYWHVALAKTQPRERYGFSHATDDSEFSCARGDLETPRAPTSLMVKAVAPEGLLASWNDDHPEAEVTSTDRIVEVNGIAGDTAEMQAQLTTGSIRMRICRYPARFSVRLARDEGQMFGVKFVVRGRLARDSVRRPSDGAEGPGTDAGEAEAEEAGGSVACLQIQALHPQGLLELHNLAQISRGQFHYVVTKGMAIEAVNDVRGNAETLIETLRTCTDVQLVIQRGEVVSVARSRAKLQMRILLALRGESVLSAG